MESTHMPFTANDGGRAAAGYKGHAGDCVTRAIAIASGKPYQEVYDRLAAGNAAQRKGKERKSKSRTGRKTALHGIFTKRQWFKAYMAELGFKWVPTMTIGSGCAVHLAEGELPMGKIIARVTRHYTAVIDGVIHDTYDPQRTTIETVDGIERRYERCVYGYWIAP